MNKKIKKVDVFEILFKLIAVILAIKWAIGGFVSETLGFSLIGWSLILFLLSEHIALKYRIKKLEEKQR